MYTNLRSAANAYAQIGGNAVAAPAVPAQDAPAPAAARPAPGGSEYSARSHANAYAKVGLETGIVAASPHQLIVMLYEGAELSVRMAIKHLHEGDLGKKSVAVSKASNIIAEGLRAALDLEQGGEIAQQLDALYEYMNQRLMLMHVRHEAAPLEEVLGLLQELHGAWKQIGAPAGAAPASPNPAAA